MANGRHSLKNLGNQENLLQIRCLKHSALAPLPPNDKCPVPLRHAVDVEFGWCQILPAPSVDVDGGWRPPRHQAQVQQRAFSIRFGSAH